MTRARMILRRVAIRTALAAVGAAVVWLGTSEFVELIGDPAVAALVGAVVAPHLYDLRAWLAARR